MQGDPLSTTIFNVVADAVVRHWFTVIVEVSYDRSRRRQEGRHQNSLFYADDIMVASSDPRWLQGVFGTLAGLFDRLGLNTNVGKTVRMVYRPCQASVMYSETAYGRRMTGSGPSYQERQQVRVKCT